MKELIESIQKNADKWQSFGFFAIATILVWSVFGVDFSHAHTWAEKNVPLFWSLFTIVAAIVLIVFAGWVAKNIQTTEDYYDR